MLWLILFLIIIGVVLKFYVFAGKKEPVLLKTDWKKDVVYLYQFQRNVHVPNLSPFCMKVELFLRANKIQYEVVEGNFTRSHKGLLPFIELNGEQIADSEFILRRLAEKHNIKENLPKERAAALQVLGRVFDEEVFWLHVYYKSQSPGFVEVMVSSLPSFLVPLAAPVFIFFLKRRLNSSRYGAHSEKELNELYERDLQAANDLLEKGKFYGGDKITIADCAVFGQLASVYMIPAETIAHEIIRKKFPALVEYQEHVILQHFGDFPCAKKLKP